VSCARLRSLVEVAEQGQGAGVITQDAVDQAGVADNAQSRGAGQGGALAANCTVSVSRNFCWKSRALKGGWEMGVPPVDWVAVAGGP
jgi:hypothetical protein